MNTSIIASVGSLSKVNIPTIEDGVAVLGLSKYQFRLVMDKNKNRDEDFYILFLKDTCACQARNAVTVFNNDLVGAYWYLIPEDAEEGMIGPSGFVISEPCAKCKQSQYDETCSEVS